MYFDECLLQYPTKALAPLMLEDYRKVIVDRRGEEEQFTSDHIAECMKKGRIFSFSMSVTCSGLFIFYSLVNAEL